MENSNGILRKEQQKVTNSKFRMIQGQMTSLLCLLLLSIQVDQVNPKRMLKFQQIEPCINHKNGDSVVPPIAFQSNKMRPFT